MDTVRNPNTCIIRRPAVLGGTPPATSFWAGASREQLAAAVAARRPHQATASVHDRSFDPAIAATVSIRRLTRAHQRQWMETWRAVAKCHPAGGWEVPTKGTDDDA